MEKYILMKTSLTILCLLFILQLNAQFTSLSEEKNYVDKNGFNLQLNTTNGLSINYERSLFRKGKYSLWANAGLGSHLPGLRKSHRNEGVQVTTPLGFSANLEISNRWRFNPSHSIQINAGLQRFQFYQPDKYKDIFTNNGFDPLAQFLEIEYRFEPKDSRWFFSAGYRHSFSNNLQRGRLNFGIGFKF